MLRICVVVFIGLLSLFLAGCNKTDKVQMVADIVLLDGNVITMDENLGQLQAVALRGHKILAVGSNEEVSRLIGASTRVIGLDGRTVIPGLIEGHGHFLSLGRALKILDLSTLTSYQEILNLVAAAVDGAQPGEWIFGRGWHQDKWQDQPVPSVNGVPTHHSLSEISANNPVFLGHASGHAAFANASALEAAGIDRETEDPAGGTLVKDANGELTGLLRETAQRLVEQVVAKEEGKLSPDIRRSQLLTRVKLAGEAALQYGITSFQDAGTDFETLDFFSEVAANNGLPVRLYVMARDTNPNLAKHLKDHYRPLVDNEFLTVRSIKRQIDGALGSHGAWLLEPYEDLTDTSGLVLETVADIEETARLAVTAGYQLNTHAIGTRANREVLDLYERVWRSAEVNGQQLRWRIEHAQHIHARDIPRFAQLGVIASIQGVHATSDGPWIASRLGEKRTEQTAYRWRDLLDSGAQVNNGTDVPVESIDPFASIYASVARIMNTGEAFYPDQAMTRYEALYSYTMANAYAAFEDHAKGSLTPGKLADLVVIDRDLLTIDTERIRGTQVHYTIVGGEVRYQHTP